MTLATLTDLPFELLTEILVDSHCSSLYGVNRRMHAVMRAASNTIRAHYLFSAWTDKTARGLLEEAFLDYCLCFPICNDVVLKTLNTWIMDGAPCRWMPEDYTLARTDCHVFMTPGQDYLISSKAFLGVSALPKRLFRDSGGKASTTYPDGFVSDITSMSNTFDDRPAEASWWPLRCALSYIASMDKFTILPMADLLLLLTILSLHPSDPDGRQRQTPCSILTVPYLAKSQLGYALARAVFQKNFGLCSLLLAYGAHPHDCDAIAISIACRTDWVEGLQLLLQCNSKEESRWARARRIIFWWALDRYESSLEPRPSPYPRLATARPLTGFKADSNHSLTSEDGFVDETYQRPTQAHYRALRERVTTRRTRHVSDPAYRRGDIKPRHVKLACDADAEDVVRYLVDRHDVARDMKSFQKIVTYLDEKERSRGAKRKRRCSSDDED